MKIDVTSGSLRLYLNEIQKYPKLTREDEIHLATKGDQRSLDQLVTSNLRYVLKLALGYKGYKIPVADLVAEGNLGLIEAAKRFDPTRGKRFMTYATFWIRAFMLQLVLKMWSIVSIGTSPMQTKAFFRLNRVQATMLARTGEIDNAKIAKHLQISERSVTDMQTRLSSKDMSIDQPAFRYAEGTPGTGRSQHIVDLLIDESPGPEDGVVQEDSNLKVQERLGRVLCALTERERFILEKRFLLDEPMTLAEIGRALKISRERVRQLEDRIKQKARLALGASLAPNGV